MGHSQTTIMVRNMGQTLWKDFLLAKKQIGKSLSGIKIDDPQKSRQRAITFVQEQFDVRLLKAQIISNALFLADKEYTNILNQTDAAKDIGIDWISIALIVLPGVGPLASGIAKLTNSASKMNNFLGYLSGNVNDINQATPGLFTDNPNDQQNGQFNASNKIVKDAMYEYSAQAGRALAFKKMANDKILDNDLSYNQVVEMWEKAGFETVDIYAFTKETEDPNKLELIKNKFLYQMLKLYTKTYVSWQMGFRWRYLGNYANLPEDGESYGDFTGMTQESRNKIYDLFGTINSQGYENGQGLMFISNTSRDYPAINGWRDMVKHWGMTIY